MVFIHEYLKKIKPKHGCGIRITAASAATERRAGRWREADVASARLLRENRELLPAEFPIRS